MLERIKARIKEREVKKHIEEHKTIYCCIATGTAVAVVAGITALVMRTNGSCCGRLYDQRRAADVYTTKAHTAIGSNFVSNSTINGNVIAGVSKKALSYIVQEDGTDRWWTSQADAARAIGHSESNISKHLNHGAPLSNGMSLTRRGVAT